MPEDFPGNPRALRRGDVVHERDHGGYIMYGRVWRRFDAEHVVVIDCGRHVRLYRDDELVLSDYEGRDRKVGPEIHPLGPDGEIDRFAAPLPRKVRRVRMTSLRRLKIMARRYDASFGGCGHGRAWTKAERAEAIANPRRFVPPAMRQAG